MSIMGMNGFESRAFAANTTDATAMDRISGAAAAVYSSTVLPDGSPSVWSLVVQNQALTMPWYNDESGTLNEPVGTFWLHGQWYQTGGNPNQQFGACSSGLEYVTLSAVNVTGELTIRVAGSVVATAVAAIPLSQYSRWMVECAFTGGSPTAGDTIKVYLAGLIDEGQEFLSYTLTGTDVTNLLAVGSGKANGFYVRATFTQTFFDDLWAMDTGASVTANTDGDTTGGTTFTSAGAAFLTSIPNTGGTPNQPTIILIGGNGYTVTNVGSNTQLTLASAPPSATGVGYKVYSYIVNAGGSVNPTAFKDSGIRGQVPTGDAIPEEWTPSTGADSYAVIDNISTSDYLQATTVGEETHVSHDAVSSLAEKVGAVKLYAKVTQSDTSAGAQIGLGFSEQIIAGSNGNVGGGGTTFQSSGQTFLTTIPNSGPGTAPTSTTVVYINGDAASPFTVATVDTNTQLTLATAATTGTSLAFSIQQLPVQQDSLVPGGGYVTNVYDERASGVEWTPANYDAADITIISVT